MRGMVYCQVVVAVKLLPSWVRAQDYSDVQIKATHVSGPIHMLEGRGGNIGVSAGDDGVLIIDDQFAPLAAKIRASLKGISPGPLKFVLNTHWHGDHTGGNPEFGPEAPIIAHNNVRLRLSTEQSLFDRVNPPLPPEGLPVITFDNGLSIHFNGEEIRVVHYPNSHTDGDSVVFFTGSNVVHMGDLFFQGMFPFVDLEHGGDVVGLRNSVKSIIDQLAEDVKIIPGHGRLANLDDLKKYHEMLKATTGYVSKRMKVGMSLEELQKGGLSDRWKEWGNGFIKADQWIATIYESLKREGK